MPSPKPSPAESSNRMNKRLKSLPRAAVAVLKQDARLPCGLLDLVACLVLKEFPGKPPVTLGRN
jgi:hypothetical protein